LRGFYGRFGFAGSLPAALRTPDGFDFGTGDPAADLAMLRLRNPAAPLPGQLTCTYKQKHA
ncbi:MAG: GNAT family N-acetyltransferase, partial [Alistipes sp.]|nr:GNAT family N-acetyltransferase [Alistipes sp.]